MHLDTNLYQASGRLTQAINNPDNYGFSCNFLSVPDSLAGINEASAWATMVSAASGAPSLDLSHIRARNSGIRRGGTTQGAVPFAHRFDAIASSCVREHNKNHAMLLGIDLNHGDFHEFLAAPFKIASKVIYLTDGLRYSNERLEALYAAYMNQPKLFIHKRKANPFNPDGFGITGCNLCTEIRDMESKDTCVLGTYNLAYYDTIEHLKENLCHDLYQSAKSLIQTDMEIKRAKFDNPLYTNLVSYSSNNMQVGLSAIGLATLMGKLGVTYRNYEESELRRVIEYAYQTAAMWVKNRFPQYVRVFTQAPTVHSHRRFRNTDDLAVSPSIEPVEGALIGDYVVCNITSATHGNQQTLHPPTTPTIYDTEFGAYANVAILWQKMLDSTGLAQNISFSVYNLPERDNFNFMNFLALLASPLNSLYYFIPMTYFGDVITDAKFVSDEVELGCDIDAYLKGRFDPAQCDCAG
jgi:hypothetical protein